MKVWREGLWDTLRKWGYGGRVLSIIKSMYRGCNTTYKLGEITSDPIDLRVGLKQGCVLSPLLFSLYIMELSVKLDESKKGLKIGDITIPALMFADDLVILGKDENELREMLNIVGKFGKERKLEFNAKKSCVLVNWRKKSDTKDWEMVGYKIKESDNYMIRIKEGKDYKYLGVYIAIRGRTFGTHEEKKMQENKVKIGRVKGFSKGSCNKAFCTKVAWDKVIIPGLLFGTEAIYTTKYWENCIGNMEMDIGRYITGASKTCSKAAMMGEIGGISVIGKMVKRKLTFARKFEWDKGSWGSTILESAKVENSKWWKQIGEYAKEFDINLQEEVGNYRLWKKYVRDRINKREIKNWREAMNKNKSAKLLRNKLKPKWEPYLIGNESARALFKLRTGDWDMWDRRKKWEKEGSANCRICGYETEDITHLLTECNIEGKPERLKKYKGKRGVAKILGLGMELDNQGWVCRRVFSKAVIEGLKKGK